MRVVDRRDPCEDGETRHCRFCTWSMTLTSVDKAGDVVDAFDRHLQRHAEALTVEGAEQAIFFDLVRQVDPTL